MDARFPMAVGVFAAGALVGFALGGAGDRVLVSRPSVVSPQPATITKVVEDAACERQLATARAELRLRDKISEDVEVETQGVPLAWDDAIPPEFQPDQVKARIERAIKECHVPVELIDWDCDEPPCYARMRALRGDWYAPLVECPAWSEVFDNSVSMASDSVDCRGGTESTLVVSPSPTWVDLEDHPLMDNMMKRFQYRMARAKDSWPCGP